MNRITIQLHDKGQWHDAIVIAFAEPEKSLNGPCELGYTSEYVKSNLDAYESLFCQAASANLPVDFGSHRLPHAPAFLYDLAPMVMDLEGITRTTKWPIPIERAGEIDWLAACHSLSEFIKPEEAFQRLRHDAQRLLALSDILSDLGLPDAVMNHPAIALSTLERRMAEWGLV